MFDCLKNWKSPNRKLLEKIMATASEIKQVLTDVKSNGLEVKSKVTAVLNKLAELQAAGNGATQEELADMLALATEAKDTQQATEDALDAAVTAVETSGEVSSDQPVPDSGNVDPNAPSTGDGEVVAPEGDKIV